MNILQYNSNLILRCQDYSSIQCIFNKIQCIIRNLNLIHIINNRKLHRKLSVLIRKTELKFLFRGACKLCNNIGHKVRDCLQLGERLACFGCGTLDIAYPNCSLCQARRNNLRNGQQETRTNPPVSYQN